MHEVGHHLQKTALAKTDSDRDAYARSAFNRYYYGVFLTVRDMFREMDSQWSRLRHAAVPSLLSGTVAKELNRASRRARKNSDRVLEQQIEKAKRSVAELKKVVTTANEVRKIADYEPEELVDFGAAQRFSLRSVEITEAHKWGQRAAVLCQSILAAWKQIHV